MDTSSSLKADKVDPDGGLQLDPSNELRFKGPFENDFSSVTLSISNPTEKRIAFKIKTTAPKRYCVKPNSGVLDPTKSMKVNVLLQPFSHDPNEKLKHKFMVQYLYLNEEESKRDASDILNGWKDVQSSRLLDIKLKCIFEPENEKSNNKVEQQQTTKTNVTSPNPAPIQLTTQDVTITSSNNNSNNNLSSNNDNELKQRKNNSVDNNIALKSNTPPSSTTTTRNNSNNDQEFNSHQSTTSSSSLDDEMSSNNNNKRTNSSSSSSQFKTATTSTLSSGNRRVESKTPEVLITDNITMLLSNKSIWIIVALIAIIVYLIIFK